MKFLSNRRVSPFSLGVFFTLARVSLALLSLRKNGDYSWSMSRPVHQSLFPGLPPKAPLSLRETSTERTPGTRLHISYNFCGLKMEFALKTGADYTNIRLI